MTFAESAFSGCDRGNLVILVNAAVVGGHETQLVHLVQRMRQFFLEIKVVSSSDAVHSFLKKAGIESSVISFALPGKVWRQYANAPAAVELLKDIIRDGCAVLVSGGTLEACVTGAKAARLCGAEKVVGYVPMWIDRSLTHFVVGAVYNVAIAYFCRPLDALITVNGIQKKLLQNAIHRPVYVFKNSIKAVVAPSISYGPRLVYVGRFDDQQKDISGLITLLDNPENPYKKLILIGDGPDKNLIFARAKQAKHIEIRFSGWLSTEELDDFLGYEDCLVMNSRWEGEPLVVREFAARGLLCVAKDVPGFRGIVKRNFRFNSGSELISILKKKV